MGESIKSREANLLRSQSFILALLSGLQGNNSSGAWLYCSSPGAQACGMISGGCLTAFFEGSCSIDRR